jgi:hypothetical protein
MNLYVIKYQREDVDKPILAFAIATNLEDAKIEIEVVLYNAKVPCHFVELLSEYPTNETMVGFVG